MRLSRQDALSLLLAAGIREDSKGKDLRSDSGETATFTRALTQILTRTLDKRFPELKARSFIPVNSEVNPGAESFVWRSWDWAGMAKIISHYADDLPMVEVLAGEQSQIVKSLGDAYGFDIQSMRAAAFSGTPIDVKRANAVRKAMENAVEQIAAVGNAAAGLPGFINNPNVPLLTAPGNINGSWLSATSDQILDDMHTMANTPVTSTLGAFSSDTMLLPVNRYSLVSTKRMSQYDSTTVLRAFLASNPYIRNVDQWGYLDNADAAGTGPRAIVYGRSPENVELFIPSEFEQLPPQWRNLAAVINCHMRIGGVVWYYPLSGMYVDGI